MDIKIENLRQLPAVIRPVYTDSGDGCEIITDNGESFYDPRGMKSVKRPWPGPMPWTLRLKAP
ncbi:MAG: hypothetical protein ACM3PE_03510 [Deltaproteobacteria bacterium]